jgi:DUF1365 family protein
MRKNCLYKGSVFHTRNDPFIHEFKYNVLYYYLDVKRLNQTFNIPLLFSFNSPGLLSFWRKDYFGNKKNSLNDDLISFIKKETNEDFEGDIFLLTNISYLGFCFNPVSFYYFYSPTEGLKYILSEITNTPWGEKHSNLLKVENKQFEFEFKKDFHVSPFVPMNVDYKWKLSNPEKNLTVEMENRYSGEKDVFFRASLELEQVSFTTFNIFKFFIIRPFMTAKTMWGIYFQSLILFLKKAPFYSHPSKEL